MLILNKHRAKAFVFALSLVACTEIETFDSRDSGASVTIEVDQSFELSLGGPSGTYATWKLGDFEREVVTMDAVETSCGSDAGSGCSTTWEFSCAAVGTTTISAEESDGAGEVYNEFALSVTCR
jgi:predicted secreted protein